MAKYLYGASVQGIQDFIFKTNKLQEIVGASEIVKSVAEEFEKISGYKDGNKNILINASGNIKAIFDDEIKEDKLNDVVLNFPKTIQQKAYGITISQAVVKMVDDFQEQNSAIKELEKRLKIQRNRPSIPLDLSLNIMKLNSRTARPAIEQDADKATQQKLKANKDFYIKNPSVTEFKDFSYMSNSKNKLAIIHIDGNGLGSIVKKLKTKLSSFSFNLDKATNDAYIHSKKDYMEIRKVILGGDDVVVICNADDALEFTSNFLHNFENNTKEITELKELNIDKLTACAGIAYTNEKYPFHYAISLAQALCSYAKKASNREASCLIFHNIKSSNFQSYDKFVKEELTITNTNDEQTIRCDFGPYYLDEKKQPSIKHFLNSVEAYRCDGSPINRLRNWINELYKNPENAKNLLNRINNITQESGKWSCKIMDKNLENLYSESKDNKLSNDKLFITKDELTKTPIYDILQVISVTEVQ